LYALLATQEHIMSQLSTGASRYERRALSGGSKTIAEFCRDNGISRSAYYRLKKMGAGPDEMRPDGSTIVRITHRAEEAWHRRGEQRAREMTIA